jgi:transposase
MFVRKKKNISGSVSIQIIDKSKRYQVVKTIGVSSDPDILERLIQRANWWIQQQQHRDQLKLFPLLTKEEQTIEGFVSQITNAQVRTVGPELIFGVLFDRLGFNRIPDIIFRHLVIARLAYPASKLKTTDYLYRYRGIVIGVDAIYRFLDKLKNKYQPEVEQIAFACTQKALKGNLTVVFYDLTTLYFETEEEDDLRKIGFSKDGKFNQPQIMVGLLVGKDGYPIGYDIFEGSTFEGHTLLPILQKFEQKFHLAKPIVIADAGLFSKDNLKNLARNGYTYIVGARIKNESEAVKQKILDLIPTETDCRIIKKGEGISLIISYSADRAKKDKYNREKGLKKLEKKAKSGRLTKEHLNNRGYNKFLKLTGEITVSIDYDKYHAEEKWDGLKGFLTNTDLDPCAVIENYNQLWRIEKAFRISKTDLRIRPIYHRLKGRIEAHICIAFVAYAIYKELERILILQQLPFSPERAAELTQTMYAIEYEEPNSSMKKTILLKMDDMQQKLNAAVNS